MFYLSLLVPISILFFFFFNDTATTEIYTLSLHDALPISRGAEPKTSSSNPRVVRERKTHAKRAARSAIGSPRFAWVLDRKSTRLNSSHQIISYAVFCLKKKKKKCIIQTAAECGTMLFQ